MGRRTGDSDSENSDSHSATQPAKPSKRPSASRKPREPANEWQAARTRSAAERRPTATQAAIDKEKESKIQEQIARLRKENAKLKSKSRAQSAPQHDASDDEDDLESEEEFESNKFPTSVTPLETITPPSPTGQVIDLRKMLKKSKKPNYIAVKHRIPRNILLDRVDNNASPSTIRTPDPFQSLPSSPSPAILSIRGPQIQSSPWPTTMPSSNISSRQPSPTSSVSIAQKRSCPPTPATSRDGTPDPKRLKVTPAFSSRYNEGGRAKVRDYDDAGQAVILRAEHDYESRIVGISPFPASQLQIQWAKSAWRRACRLAEEDLEPTERIIRLIRNRGSRIRGSLLTTVRSAVVSSYGFDITLSKTAKRHNQALYSKLLPNSAFAYKDVDALTGFAENRIVAAVIAGALFAKKLMSYGVVFKDHFDPVSLATIALILTQVKFCIAEFKEGFRQTIAFTEQAQKVSYMSMLQDVQAWSELNPAVTLKIRKRMFMKAYDIVGHKEQKVISHVTSEVKERMRAELEGRTGDTDSEDESPDVSEDDFDVPCARDVGNDDAASGNTADMDQET